MTLRAIFRATDGRLHAPWRIAVFLVTGFVLFVAFAIVMAWPLRWIERVVGLAATANAIAATLAILGAHVVMLRWVDRRPWSYAWMGRGAADLQVISGGFALGAIPVAAASAALLGLGWLSVVTGSPGSWWTAALQVTLLLAVAALFEELLSRGYLLAALADWMGMPAAVAITSLGFGLLHLGNPGVTAQPIALVTLAGVFLAGVLLATKSLYAAWAAHLAWNWVMAVPMHVAVSGVALPLPGYAIVDSGPDWATGGPWGPEGGAFAGVAMLAMLGVLGVRTRRAARSTPAPHLTPIPQHGD